MGGEFVSPPILFFAMRGACNLARAIQKFFMTDFLSTAIDAARAAGKFLRENFGATPDVNAFEAHDIKLELDVRSQDLITKKILSRFPDHAIYGEEGIAGNQSSEFQWIVDPIDGTVNYFYAIPHFCV